MNYLYKTVLYTNPSSIANIDTAQEESNISDFQTNYQASTLKVNDLELLSDTALIIKTYSDFKALVDGVTITWADIKLEDGGWFYDLYLLTDAPL